MPKHPLEDAFGHHVWATHRIIEACAPLNAEQLGTTVPGTYGSIIETLRHTVGADAGYLNLLSDGARAQIDEDAMDLHELRAAMDENGARWSDLLARSPDPDVVAVRHRDDGSELHAPIGIRLAQALHHGTDHRSQICTALTSLGIEPPEIDVWAYGWERGTTFETQPPPA